MLTFAAGFRSFTPWKNFVFVRVTIPPAAQADTRKYKVSFFVTCEICHFSSKPNLESENVFPNFSLLKLYFCLAIMTHLLVISSATNFANLSDS